MLGVQRGAEHPDHRSGRGVEDRSPGRSAAQPERVRAGRADRQLQCLVEEMEAIGRRVRHAGAAQHPGLAPAARGDPDVGAGLDPLAHGDGERVESEALGAYERQIGFGERGHGVGGHHTAAVAGRVQHEAGQTVDGLVAGDHRAVVVGDETRAARTSGQVADAHQGRVPRAAGVVRCLLVPGPRAPFRHDRTSPRRAPFPDGRRQMISGTDHVRNAPPSAPSVHSERLPEGVNRAGRMDTQLGGGTEGGPWSGGHETP